MKHITLVVLFLTTVLQQYTCLSWSTSSPTRKTTASTTGNIRTTNTTGGNSSRMIAGTTMSTTRDDYDKLMISRRNVLIQQLASFVGVSGTVSAFMSPPLVAHAAESAETTTKTNVLRSEKCAYGEGEGCSSLAGDNEFIRELQRKSKERKELAQKVIIQNSNIHDF